MNIDSVRQRAEFLALEALVGRCGSSVQPRLSIRVHGLPAERGKRMGRDNYPFTDLDRL